MGDPGSGPAVSQARHDCAPARAPKQPHTLLDFLLILCTSAALPLYSPCTVEIFSAPSSSSCTFHQVR